MAIDLPRSAVTDSLRRFKTLRDALLHEDVDEFGHHLQRFVAFCQDDPLLLQVLEPILQSFPLPSEQWWQELFERSERERGIEAVNFPSNSSEELALRFRILQDVAQGTRDTWGFGVAVGVHKLSEATERFKSVIVRPFCEELSSRLSDAAQIASPEIRALQAVPPNRIPGEREIRIFLSHKTVDKPLVIRYHRSLSELGYSPWLDEPELHAGKILERGLLSGFEESCAAVFFITENFKDEGYLATEVDYAIRQKRKKGEKFSIITLIFSDQASVPGLLEDYVSKRVSNDLDGLYEVVRALPIELGPVRWKQRAVSE